MKEININIEGYNVNGICVGCLNYNRRMFYDNDAKEVYKIIGNIDVPDGLTIQVCWECLAAVKSVIRFQKQILDAFEVLISYSKEHTFLNSPKDFSKYSTSRLALNNKTEHIDIGNDVVTVEADEKPSVAKETTYIELDPVPIKEEVEDSYLDELYSGPVQHESSDDDIQLSHLKDKENRRQKTKKKVKKKLKKVETDDTETKGRKLKNLPADIVQLYTMTEEEMWVVRARDVASEAFTNLKRRCNDCIISFNTDKLRDYHINTKHKPKSKNSLKCDVCKAYFLTKENLSTHRSLHLRAYRCTECDHVTTIKRAMVAHECTQQWAAQIYNCNDCDMVFGSKSKLNYHRNVKHQERPQCDCCGKVFANKMTLKYHLKILTPKDSKSKETVLMPCKHCNKVFNSKKSYRAHVVIHSGVVYPCPECGKQFRWRRNLHRHAQAHSDRAAPATLHCRDCNKTFSSRDCLNNHLKLSKKHVTSDALKHECNYCGKKFTLKWCLMDHINWEHLKIYKHQCNVCFKIFKSSKILVTHMRTIHLGNRKEDEGEHLCEICGKSYKSDKRLKGHVWAMHTQRETAKTYKCRLCSATFTWQTSVYKHMRMMHETTKQSKVPRVAVVKKPEAYPDVEITYYHNLPNLSTVHSIPTQPNMLI